MSISLIMSVPTARVIAREFNYSEDAINYCWEDGISAGDLVDKLWDLHFDDREYPFPIFRDLGSKTEERLKLEEETLRLQFQQVCVTCLKKERRVLYLPCGHLVCCESCVDSSCQVCKVDVLQKIHTFH